MKNKLINICLILALVAGLSLLLYPTLSDYWNSLHASQAVASYDQAVKSMDEGKYDELLQRAGQYNRDLFLRGTLFALTDEEREDYNSQLDIDGSGVMGYIEIPTIKVSLPIYHGTSDWSGARFPSAARAPTASSPATGVFPAPSSLRI